MTGFKPVDLTLRWMLKRQVAAELASGKPNQVGAQNGNWYPAKYCGCR
jgi:hypothetical protein